MASTPSASTAQPAFMNECEKLMEQYDGFFIEQHERTWFAKKPESLMADKKLGIALMAQLYPLLDTHVEETYVNMRDPKLRARLMELARKGTRTILVFMEYSYARIFRFVEFDETESWRLGMNLGIEDLRKMTTDDPRRLGYGFFEGAASPSPPPPDTEDLEPLLKKPKQETS